MKNSSSSPDTSWAEWAEWEQHGHHKASLEGLLLLQALNGFVMVVTSEVGVLFLQSQGLPEHQAPYRNLQGRLKYLRWPECYEDNRTCNKSAGSIVIAVPIQPPSIVEIRTATLEGEEYLRQRRLQLFSFTSQERPPHNTGPTVTLLRFSSIKSLATVTSTRMIPLIAGLFPAQDETGSPRQWTPLTWIRCLRIAGPWLYSNDLWQENGPIATTGDPVVGKTRPRSQ
ncbi:aryl hydrocarbon receptor-like isoform X1 [Lates japonicus]|uniref:Aryl hydrocarbon receptor-like isoform X1 n=1 Tax=Lates japonicus TaxID=270547 RepID=A0AAD3NK27_LATJO|nr:aryl hydrocarbon receptor-like isoform X1 [Lates japonicus]